MVGIVFCSSLNMCPYIDKYIDACEKLNIEYEVIIWDRQNNGEEYPDHIHVYREKTDVYKSKWKKIGEFLRFRKFLLKVLKKRQYEKIIMLTTLPAVLCFYELIKNYRGKYIFDFRDLSFEQFGVYRKLVQRICDCSAFTCISSPGFSTVLGDRDYVIANNFRYFDLRNRKEAVKQIDYPLQILYLGVTRGEVFNRRLANVFGNDSRFKVKIVGFGNDTPSFVEYTKQFSNIHVEGTYHNDEKLKYIEDADLLLYYYPDTFNCKYALANKYYDGLIFKKPLICNSHSYSGQRVQKKGLGIAADLSKDDFADLVYEYMQSFNERVYEAAVNDELNSVLQEDAIYLSHINTFLQTQEQRS